MRVRFLFAAAATFAAVAIAGPTPYSCDVMPSPDYPYGYMKDGIGGESCFYGAWTNGLSCGLDCTNGQWVDGDVAGVTTCADADARDGFFWDPFANPQAPSWTAVDSPKKCMEYCLSIGGIDGALGIDIYSIAWSMSPYQYCLCSPWEVGSGLWGPPYHGQDTGTPSNNLGTGSWHVSTSNCLAMTHVCPPLQPPLNVGFKKLSAPPASCFYAAFTNGTDCATMHPGACSTGGLESGNWGAPGSGSAICPGARDPTFGHQPPTAARFNSPKGCMEYCLDMSWSNLGPLPFDVQSIAYANSPPSQPICLCGMYQSVISGGLQQGTSIPNDNVGRVITVWDVPPQGCTGPAVAMPPGPGPVGPAPFFPPPFYPPPVRPPGEYYPPGPGPYGPPMMEEGPRFQVELAQTALVPPNVTVVNGAVRIVPRLDGRPGTIDCAREKPTVYNLMCRWSAAKKFTMFRESDGNRFDWHSGPLDVSRAPNTVFGAAIFKTTDDFDNVQFNKNPNTRCKAAESKKAAQRPMLTELVRQTPCYTKLLNLEVVNVTVDSGPAGMQQIFETQSINAGLNMLNRAPTCGADGPLFHGVYFARTHFMDTPRYGKVEVIPRGAGEANNGDPFALIGNGGGIVYSCPCACPGPNTRDHESCWPICDDSCQRPPESLAHAAWRRTTTRPVAITLAPSTAAAAAAAAASAAAAA